MRTRGHFKYRSTNCTPDNGIGHPGQVCLHVNGLMQEKIAQIRGDCPGYVKDGPL